MIATLSNLRLPLPMAQIAGFCRRWSIARLDAVLYEIVVLGEAARRLSSEEVEFSELRSSGRVFWRDMRRVTSAATAGWTALVPS